MILICTVHTLIGRVVPSSRAEYYDNDKNLAEISDFVSEAESETPFFPYMRLSYCNLPIASFSSTMYLWIGVIPVKNWIGVAFSNFQASTRNLWGSLKIEAVVDRYWGA